ncbi:response regulator transcription factor [Bacillota bacterium LX-D]|nr:response regulator transcription factor [Bacillota bacterium LX-D]
MKIKILVADDEPKIRQLVKVYLEKEGFEVIEAGTGKEALLSYRVANLAILDVMMPEGDGWLICREIRRNSDIPIIMLTARSEEMEKLMGFDLGADDYITKPFSPSELVARVKVILKRTLNNDEKKDAEIILGELKINTASRKVTVKDMELSLTPKEFDLLLYLSKQPNRVFSREQLLEQVWGYNFISDVRAIDTHIKNIREKFSTLTNKKYIHTVWGIGYKFEN